MARAVFIYYASGLIVIVLNAVAFARLSIWNISTTSLRVIVNVLPFFTYVKLGFSTAVRIFLKYVPYVVLEATITIVLISLPSIISEPL